MEESCSVYSDPGLGKGRDETVPCFSSMSRLFRTLLFRSRSHRSPEPPEQIGTDRESCRNPGPANPRDLDRSRDSKPRDSRERDTKSRDCPVPCLAHPCDFLSRGISYLGCPQDFCPGSDCPVALSLGPDGGDLSRGKRPSLVRT